jgi:hypothetical protein
MRTKILLTTAILFCFAWTSNAQLNEGNYLLGGSLSYSNAKNTSTPNDDYTGNYFGANVQIGRLVKNNTVLGVIISYSNSNSHLTGYPDSNYNKGNAISAGVFYRKYKRLIKDLYFFGELDGVYSHSKSDQNNSNYYYYITKTSSDGGTVSFVPGISYAVCNKLYIELLMPNILAASYVHSTTAYTSGVPPILTSGKGNNFSLNANLNFNLLSNFGIGFKFLLGK